MQQNEEWISIGDLMGGFVGVLLLLLIVPMADNARMSKKLEKGRREIGGLEERVQQAEAKAMNVQARLDEATRPKPSAAEEAVKRIDNLLVANTGLSRVMGVDVPSRKVLIKDGFFDSSSACLNDSLVNNLTNSAVSAELKAFLEGDSSRRILVEGHTDAQPVGAPVANLAKNCGLYNDNYTLSAARAKQGRDKLVAGWNKQLQDRVGIAGYGPAVPRSADDSGNRRIEIMLIDFTR